jgi:perosamine synthetase
MMDKAQREKILSRGKTAIEWEGEPFLGSSYGEEEVEAAVDAIRDSMLVSRGFGGDSPQIPNFEKAFAAYVGTKHAVALNSAGPGLDMAMKFLKLQPGDEVIVPAINFVASPLAVTGAGGQIVWCDVDPQTLQLDLADVEKRITPRTRALFPVHMNGLSAPMDELAALAEAHDLPVIYDAARACGGKYKGRPLGKDGLMTLFSFHTMKNMCTLGEGGMMTTDDDDVNAFFRNTRFFGMNTGIWGSSYVMNKVQAAVGMVQLEKLDTFIEQRRNIAAVRNELLADAPHVTLPHQPDDCMHTYYLYTCLLDEDRAGEKRATLMQRMDEEYGVKCLVANPPAYESHALLREVTQGQNLPRSESIGQRILCIPNHPKMSQEDNEYICAALLECLVEG